MTDGTLELIQALRQALETDTVVANAGIFFGRVPREDTPPYVMMTVSANLAHQNLKECAWREFVVTIKASAIEASGKEGIEIAGDLAGRVYTLLVNGQALLNTYLNPLGWNAMHILEFSSVPAYDDEILEVVRWNMGNLFHIRIQTI